ncbi:DUF7693 family protein [Paraburkholderia tropica]|uniref:DUF7693 family protein n=1 Tax=Paraburkholderia tropica TaxID=92647 RepID=UPI00160F872B|nr:hypothetical protein [Paraburkholderia tropica]MBB2981804.1 hypothetical protein [Paraburkholderia tropica]
MTPAISAEEVAEILRGAAHGRLQLTVIGERWSDVHCGDVEVSVAGWTIVIFNDCMDVDYVDSAVSPDGRSVEYSDWFEAAGAFGADPIDLLSGTDGSALRELLERS